MPRHVVYVVFGALTLFAFAGCTTVVGQEAAPARVTMAGFNPLSPAIADALHRKLPDITFAHDESGVATSNVEALQQGMADLGLTFADIAYIGYTGRLEGHPARLDKLRGIAVLQLTPLHLIVRNAVDIRGVDDLCGHKVGVGVPGSGTSLTSALTLGVYPCKTPVVAEHLVYNDALKQFQSGALDAMFVIQGYPSDMATAALHSGGRLVEITGTPVTRLRTEYPFLRPAMIPAGTYPDQHKDVHTVGVDMLLACRAGLDETLVYRITRALFDSLPELSNKVAALRMLELDRTMAMPIPLHEGAARYYRERELTR